VAEPPEALGATEETESPTAETVQPASRPLTKLERLQQRMPFKINHAAIAARRVKAQEIFRAAQLSQNAGRLKEAEASIRIAISFDPARSEFKEALGSIRIQAAGARATKLLAGPSERMSDGDLRAALTLLEDVLIYRPHDPELNNRAACVSMQLGKLDLALEYAETLLERSSDVAATHTLLGRIQRERGDTEAAVRAYEAALKCDEEDLEARRALASMRIGARDAVRGGKS
jgi:tetratricopeptide (TPR) repeat protein